MYSSPKPHVLDRKWIERASGRYRLLWHLRNDDVFILRWGEPEFVRVTVRNMRGPDAICFVEGSELDRLPGVHLPDFAPDRRSHLFRLHRGPHEEEWGGSATLT